MAKKDNTAPQGAEEVQPEVVAAPGVDTSGLGPLDAVRAGNAAVAEAARAEHRKALLEAKDDEEILATVAPGRQVEDHTGVYKAGASILVTKAEYLKMIKTGSLVDPDAPFGTLPLTDGPSFEVSDGPTISSGPSAQLDVK